MLVSYNSAIKSFKEQAQTFQHLISDHLKVLSMSEIDIQLPFYAYFLKRREEDRVINQFLELFNKWQHPNYNEEKILW